MSQAENRSPEKALNDSTSQFDSTKKSYREVAGKYQELLVEVGVVQTCCVGKKPGLKTGFIWNILTKDFTQEQIQQDPRFTQLSAGAVTAITGCKDYMPLRIANIIPSLTATLRSRYEQNGLVFEEIPVRESIGLPIINSESTSDSLHSSDMLIGDLESASYHIQSAHKIAERAILDFGDDPKETERIMGLTTFDQLKDKKAGEILKDIAVARNSTIKGGFARGFELLAEPTRVLEDIVENIYDAETIENITELDVQGAIESGALICSFGSQKEMVNI